MNKYKTTELLQCLKEEILFKDDFLGCYKFKFLEEPTEKKRHTINTLNILLSRANPEAISTLIFDYASYGIALLIEYNLSNEDRKLYYYNKLLIFETIYDYHKYEELDLSTCANQYTIWLMEDIEFGFKIINEVISRKAITLIQRNKLLQKIKKYKPMRYKYNNEDKDDTKLIHLKEFLTEMVVQKLTK